MIELKPELKRRHNLFEGDVVEIEIKHKIELAELGIEKPLLECFLYGEMPNQPNMYAINNHTELPEHIRQDVFEAYRRRIEQPSP